MPLNNMEMNPYLSIYFKLWCPRDLCSQIKQHEQGLMKHWKEI